MTGLGITRHHRRHNANVTHPTHLPYRLTISRHRPARARANMTATCLIRPAGIIKKNTSQPTNGRYVVSGYLSNL